MKYDEAKNVLNDVVEYPSLTDTGKFHYSKGYIDAIEKAERILLNAIRHINNPGIDPFMYAEQTIKNWKNAR